MRHLLHLAALAALVPSNAAAVTQIWLSSVGVPDGTVEVGNVDEVFASPGGSGQLYVWIRPEEAQVLDSGVSLNLKSTAPGVIDFTDVTVHNPTNMIPVPEPPGGALSMARWLCLSDSTTPGTAECGGDGAGPVLDLSGLDDNTIDHFQGFLSLSQVIDILAGIGNEGLRDLDELYDPVQDAWLFATIGYDVIGTGTTELFLQIGHNGIAGRQQHSSTINVVFGGGNDPPLNGNNDREISSASADGSITVVPEPSTLILAAIVLLGLVALGQREQGDKKRGRGSFWVVSIVSHGLPRRRTVRSKPSRRILQATHSIDAWELPSTTRRQHITQ